LVDFVTADLMLPAGGIFIALFAGWIMKKQDSEKELELGSYYPYWKTLIRYAAPLSVFIIFAHAMGLL
jgi:NSS family neurotransmitter:Na+ symporter